MSLAARLGAYLERRRPQFDWAEANCCHFAGSWVAEVEGTDPMAGISTPSRDAIRALVRSMGGMSAAITQRMGRDPIEPSLAQVGYVVLMCRDDASMVGICAGRTAMFVTEDGWIAHVPMAEVSYAWRVGA